MARPWRATGASKNKKLKTKHARAQKTRTNKRGCANWRAPHAAGASKKKRVREKNIKNRGCVKKTAGAPFGALHSPQVRKKNQKKTNAAARKKQINAPHPLQARNAAKPLRPKDNIMMCHL